MENNTEVEVRFVNDVLFKYVIAGNDEDSKFVRHAIIEAITGIKPKDSIVLNPEILPVKARDNRIILDVRVQDDAGREFDIEMQMYGSTKTEYIRFQYYLGKMLANQVVKKSHYEKVKPVYEIVFMDRASDKRFINHHQLKDDDGDPTKENRMNLYIVSLKNINKIRKEKGVQGMNSFESLCCLFKNGITADILEVGERMVMVFVKKREEMKQNLDIWSYACSHEIGERRVWLMQQDKYEEGLAEGQKIGEKAGIKIGERAGIQIGEKNGRTKLLQEILMAKYHVDSSAWLSTLTKQQLDAVAIQMLSCDSFEELKQRSIKKD